MKKIAPFLIGLLLLAPFTSFAQVVSEPTGVELTTQQQIQELRLKIITLITELIKQLQAQDAANKISQDEIKTKLDVVTEKVSTPTPITPVTVVEDVPLSVSAKLVNYDCNIANKNSKHEDYNPITFHARYSVTATGKDAYIPISSKDATVYDTDFDVSQVTYTQNVGGNLQPGDTAYLVPKGKTQEFNFYMSMKPAGTSDEEMSQVGPFSVTLNGIKYSDSPSLSGIQTQSIERGVVQVFGCYSNNN